ncbi:hypothetical protein BJ878DRAFT_225320 [Calycina marina]|uniref:Rhodopsin domain-containing protein n=1 Tax=Calycina marina TaxID=1763456 RepID=A0A9P7YX82_9HELO|nr:hypothetical protein BJ878DRAFT_225320 [Calycina marina]
MTDSDYRGNRAGATAVGFLVASWVAVTIRVYVRGYMMKAFGIDDYLCIIALFLFSLYCAFVLIGVQYGTGKHLITIFSEPNGDDNFVIAMRAWWIAELGYVSCTTVLKISIGFFILRVCVKPIQKIVIWVVIGVNTAYSFYYFALVIFQCLPVDHFWNQYNFASPSSGRCVSTTVIIGSTYAHSSLSILADWTLGVMPIFLVWNLAMTPRTKLSVAAILAMGAVGSVATIVRIPFIQALATTLDFLFANVDVSIWSTIEPGVGITACSLATLKPLFSRFLARSRLLGSSTKMTSQGWTGTPSASKGYYRSQGNDNMGNSFQLSGLQKSSVHTTILSMRVSEDVEEGDRPNILKGQRGGNASEWNSEDPFAAPEDADSILEQPIDASGSNDGIRKTTQIITISEYARQHELQSAHINHPNDQYLSSINVLQTK